jgi:hypothetical protein
LPLPEPGPVPNAVRFLGVIPIFLHWRDLHRGPDGEAIGVVEHVWATRGRWKHLRTVDRRGGWKVKGLGLFVVAHRLIV